MLAVGIPVEDVDLEGPVVISVAEISNFELGRLPDWIEVVLDHFALVDDCKLAREKIVGGSKTTWSKKSF